MPTLSDRKLARQRRVPASGQTRHGGGDSGSLPDLPQSGPVAGTLPAARRLVLDLNWGGRLEDGRGITLLVCGERRNGDIPDDLSDGEAVLLADEDGLPDGSPA